MLILCISPVSGIRTEAMIHYSESAVSVEDEIFLEQGYSFKVVDMNSNSGDILIELYLNGEKVGRVANFAKKDYPFEYVRSIIEDDEETEVDYFILRITPEGSVKKSDNGIYSNICIEQYIDPVEDVDDYLILDKSYTLKDDSKLELAGLYTLTATGVDDGKVSLELRLNGKLVKEDEVEEGDYFYYTIYSDKQVQTIFLANVRAFFKTDDSITVFLKHVSLQPNSIYGVDGDNEYSNGIGINVKSPVDGGLKAGRVAIVSYYIDDSFPAVRIMVDGELVDSRRYVNPGVYKAVTNELDAGVHKATLMTIDEDDEISYYSEEFSVSVNIKGNITESIIEMTNSATEGFGSRNASDKSANLTLLSLPSTSNVSNMVSLIVTTGVFVVFIIFFKKFR